MKKILIAAVAALALAPASSASAARGVTYTQAKHAVQGKADKLAGQRTRVSSLLHLTGAKWYVQSKWTVVDPAGCKGCEYNAETGEVGDSATETSCFAGFNVSRSKKTGKIVVKVDSNSCA